MRIPLFFRGEDLIGKRARQQRLTTEHFTSVRSSRTFSLINGGEYMDASRNTNMYTEPLRTPCSNQAMLSRRSFVAITALAPPRLLHAAPTSFSPLPAALAQLEQTNGGRLGVATLDTATGERSGHRADERFPMCSTFKFLLASAVLERVDRRQETLHRAITVPPKPLLFNSPLTEPHAGGTMTIAALCHAVLTRSDNTAANLLLESIGGTASMTSFSRSIGDIVTRLDRMETALNECLAGRST
jgi:beta-lactamase class A